MTKRGPGGGCGRSTLQRAANSQRMQAAEASLAWLMVGCVGLPEMILRRLSFFVSAVTVTRVITSWLSRRLDAGGTARSTILTCCGGSRYRF
jgi:hypothetical protein